MAITLKIGGVDLSGYLRLAPGEGFDPMDPNLLQPGFAESSDEGAPLISEQVNNREMVFPVHVTPLKDAAYADTKDGLHAQIADLNRLLADTAGRQVEWRDDGASSSTFYEARYAKFEPDFNFRRGQRLWASGVVRVWTRPFGNSGTWRTIGTGAATGVGVAMPVVAGTVGGDVAADLEVSIGVGSYSIGDGRIVGVSVVPSGYAWDIPSASLIAPPGAGSIQDIYNLGSYALAVPTIIGTSTSPILAAQIPLSPASMYRGRTRMFAMVTGNGQEVAAYLAGARLGGGIATSNSLPGHSTVDLGVLDITPLPGQATITVDLFVTRKDNITWDHRYPGHAAGGDKVPNIARIIVLPEDSTALMVDSNRRLVAYDPFFFTSIGDDSLYRKDSLGNAAAWSASMSYFPYNFSPANEDWEIIPPSGTTNPYIVAIDHDSITDMEAYLEYDIRTLGRPSVSAALGKGIFDDVFVNAYTDYSPMSRGWAKAGFNATIGFLSIHNPLGTGIASVGIVGVATVGIISVKYGGPNLRSSLWNLGGGLIASVVASCADFAYGGQVMFGAAATGSGPAIIGFLAQEVPSTARAPRDVVVLSSATQAAYQNTQAGVFSRDLSQYLRGRIPQLSATIPQRVVALHLPFGAPFQRVADTVDVSVAVLERWRYAR